jgi:hypothetical protein
MTRARLASLPHEELLAYEREHHGDPYMTLARANEVQRVALAGVWPLAVAARSSSSSLNNPCPPQTARDPGVVITTACIVILDDLPETLDEFLLTYTGQGGRLICREP